LAQLSRWAIFVRAFLIALLAGAPARVAGAASDEVAAWTAATQADSIDGYYSYLSRYPTGEYVDRAISALVRLGAITQSPQVRQLPRVPKPVPTPAPTRVTDPGRDGQTAENPY
jgi:hypothetical protein